jgi:4-amino-4-deoxy-L-arabinose transferase-like glycosyltransferase
LLWVVGLTLGVRLFYFASARSPSFRDPLIDGDFYDYLATRIAGGEGFDPGPFWQPPLYPLVLAGLYRLLGHDLLWPRLLQVGLDALTAVLAMRVATTLVKDPKWGMAAGIVVAVHGPMVFYAGEILPTNIAATLGMLAVYLAVTHRSRWDRALGAGASVGAGALLVAPVLLLIAPVAWAVGKKRWQRGAAAAAVCIAMVGCATLANWIRTKEFVPISANGGINLYIGNHPDSDKWVAIRPGAEWEALTDEPARQGIGTMSGQDRYFVGQTLEICKSDVFRCAARFAWKLQELLMSRDIPRNESLDLIKRDSWVLALLNPRIGPIAFPYIFLLPLGVAGTIVAFRSKRRSARVVAFSLCALAAAPILFFVTGRYRIQLVPELAVLAVFGAHALRFEFRARRIEAAAAVVTLLLAARPIHLPVDDVPFESEMHYVIGGRRARLGDDTGAVRAWKIARALRPGYLEAGFNLGLALERMGRIDEAKATYRELLSYHPQNGLILERLNQLEPH